MDFLGIAKADPYFRPGDLEGEPRLVTIDAGRGARLRGRAGRVSLYRRAPGQACSVNGENGATTSAGGRRGALPPGHKRMGRN